MPDIFDEVSEDLRAERMRRLLQRYGFLLVVAAVLIVAGAAGWQGWQYRQRAARAAVAERFMAAMQITGATDTPERKAATDTYAELAANGPAGYRTLARLRLAGARSQAGDLQGALALWDQVSADETADRSLRRVADLLWVQHQVDSGDPALVEGRIQPLVAPGEPWRPLALEARALLKLRTGDTEGAANTLREIVGIPTAPAGVRNRATGLLARLDANQGKQG